MVITTYIILSLSIYIYIYYNMIYPHEILYFHGFPMVLTSATALRVARLGFYDGPKELTIEERSNQIGADVHLGYTTQIQST